MLTARDLASQTRSKRQERLHALRMAKAKPGQVKAKKAQLENEINLVKAPASLLKAGQEEQQAEKIPVEEAMQVDAGSE